jgi:hypothetical protein
VTAEQELRIRWEWEPAESIRNPEHRATWARIEIKAGTDVINPGGGQRLWQFTPLDLLSALPFAEWIAYNWWFLQSGTRPSNFLTKTGR